jgi:3-isopropylmalate/(R)-2-methylmalate dehydratase small subunit
MEAFTKLSGVVAPLDRVNVDTDQIIPKQFLKRIERTGYGQWLFFDWRLLEDGSPNPDFEPNGPGYEDASILVSGPNFGSGSSREHAPWALLDYGYRCVIAPSFADIFYNNCFQNGLLPVKLSEETVGRIMHNAQERPGYRLNVDLEALRVWDDDEDVVEGFTIDEFRRHSILNGLDDIGLTLANESDITTFEGKRSAYGGVLTG